MINVSMFVVIKVPVIFLSACMLCIFIIAV